MATQATQATQASHVAFEGAGCEQVRHRGLADRIYAKC
jgi:hypothetical protein